MATGTDSVRKHVNRGIVFKTRLAKHQMRSRSFSVPAASCMDPSPPITRSLCVTSRSQHTLVGTSWRTHGCGVLQLLSWRGGVHVPTAHGVPWPPGCDRVIMSMSRGHRLQEVQLLPSSGKVPASTYGAPPDEMMTGSGQERGPDDSRCWGMSHRSEAFLCPSAPGLLPNDGHRRREPRPERSAEPRKMVRHGVIV